MACAEPRGQSRDRRNFIPVEEVRAKTGNRYRAVILAAKEARRINTLAKSRDQGDDRKVTSIALQNLLRGKLKYYERKRGVQQAPATRTESGSDERGGTE